MQAIDKLLKEIKRTYDDGNDTIDHVRDLALQCIDKLKNNASITHQPSQEGKEYVIYSCDDGLSRPILSSIFIDDTERFRSAWNKVIEGIDPRSNKINLRSVDQEKSEALVNGVVYTAIISFAACYDIWKPKSRKTPGTYFEVVLGSLLGKLIPTHSRGKHIPLEDTGESVSTDIVFTAPGRPGLVFPAKITTRERIVQPFAHQRILDSVFGEDKFRSILLCISETQRDDLRNGVNDICVPGTIRLFQRHLATIDFICYADPPTRYLQDDVAEFVAIKTIGWLLVTGLKEILA